MKDIIVGTRGSKLALAQSGLVVDKLASYFPDYNFKLKVISTKGDRILDKALSQIGGKGLFIKEIEIALLNREVDLAIHSIKDMPARLEEGLEIIGIPRRANALDVLVSKDNLTLDDLPKGSRIGTGSLRRRAQILNYRSDLEVEPLRGNIDTRLKRVAEGDFDGIILAAAGLERIGWEDRITQYINQNISIPAVGQGALAIEGRSDDDAIKEVVEKLNDRPTIDTVKAERSFLDYLEGDCKVPIGAYGEVDGDKLILSGVIGKIDGSLLLKDSVKGSRSKGQDLGVELAKKLIDKGAKEILEEIRRGEQR
ncbi:hydroxymethylbilane synthase [Halonatronum saccharophilum]|uniref:hydroxymethylbilane synthase n=1 Tax=Halonatronum saccharophilum TaxID=150060 RepID=UPI00048699D1|nr:hydroxymethylbilane synthase [Halonatronum saccharophilum]